MRQVIISRKSVEAHEVCSLELVDPQGRDLPPFSAGSHIDVHLPDGLVRQYSLWNDPSETHRYRIAVLRDAHSRGGSLGMHALQPGMSLHISDPKNHFALVKDARHSLLFAGGIGITPLLCMAEHLHATRASFALHYCTRSPERTAFAEHLRTAAFASQVHVHHDNGAETSPLDVRAAIGAPADGRHLYVCGPSGFMEAVLGTARGLGWPEDRLHREYFAAAPIDTRGDGGFEVQIASTGAVIRIAPEQSVVAALADAGIDVPTSCEQGVCGTCLTRVLDGIPEHRDMYLTPDEQARGDQFLPCCSRATSARLVLDL